MKAGLLAARHALIGLPMERQNYKECIAKLSSMIEAYNQTIQLAESHNGWVAYRGSFVNFSESLYGEGKTSGEAVARLLNLEANAEG